SASMGINAPVLTSRLRRFSIMGLSTTSSAPGYSSGNQRSLPKVATATVSVPSGRGVGAVCAEETASGHMHAIRLNTANHGRHTIALPPGTLFSAPCPLLLHPHLFHKQVGLVIEAMIFHYLPVGLVEGVPADVHPLHLISEPTLNVGADLLA